MLFKRGVRLQFAFSILVIFAILSTITVNWILSAQALKASLTENYLDSNYEYTKKLSSSTSDLLTHMQSNINALGEILGHQSFRQEDLDAWRSANSKHFNSLFIVDHFGVIETISPSVVQFKNKVQAGEKIQSKTIQNALLKKEAFISEPYRATSGQLIMLVSAPIFDDAGIYKGLIAGTLYLESDSALSHMLGEHDKKNGSYVYVVDSTGRILYHPDRSRINGMVAENPAVADVIKGRSGSKQLKNSYGNEFFAGYSYIEGIGWGIVSQTPVSVIEEPLWTLLKKVIFNSLPLIIIILAITWVITKRIVKPINTLANFSEHASNEQKSAIPVHKTNIYEIRQLYYHFDNHLNLLNKQIQLDGLTGLANRRTFDTEIKQWIKENRPFSLIMLDIDHFKKVNDVYGHLTGDDVLKDLACTLKSFARDEDLCFRYGGEEFGILLQAVNVKDAYHLSEQLRSKIAETPSPTGEPITISLGVTASRKRDSHPEEIIKRADTALYQSNASGRNKTTIFKD